MALRGKDLDRLGAGARRQIDAFRIAEKARDELLRVQAPGPRSSRHKAKRVDIDGRSFASKAEGNRYLELRRREAIGLIRELECQPRFPLVVAGVKVATYVGDFSYLDGGTGELVVEDVKGKGAPLERVFQLKRRLVEALYPFKIRIIEL
jgi:hypothetical protein